MILPKERFTLLPRIGLGRQETPCPTPYSPASGKFDAGITGRTLQKLVRHLKQNTGAVSGAGITALRPPVSEIFEDLEPLRTMSCDFWPLMLTTKPIPQESFSCSGS